MSAGKVKVQVRDGWAVYNGKAQRGSGEVLDADPDQGKAWLAAGWVNKVTSTRTTTKKK
jgi:hypothetical protein